MTAHGYPLASLRADYIRTGIGLSLSAGPLFLVATHPVAIWTLAGLSILFLAYGLRTAFRQATRIEISDDVISHAGPQVFGRANPRLSWSQLTRFHLRYYSTRRGREGGWMQLVLTSDSGKLKIESSLDGFGAVVTRAARAARDRGLEPDPATVKNLAALGIRYDASPAPAFAPASASGRR